MLRRTIVARLATVAAGIALTIAAGVVYIGSFEGLSLFLRGHTVFAEKALVDAGTVSTGEEYLVEYVIRNKFCYVVEIVGGRASCGCAVPENLPIKVPPMDEVVLRVRFRPPEGVTETIKNSILLFLDNGQEALQLQLQAKVVDEAQRK